MRRMFLVVAVLLVALAARADGTAINVDSRGVAIDGYDAVSYFQSAGVQRGKEELSADWQGATW
jgi:YHS domain-containing protein